MNAPEEKTLITQGKHLRFVRRGTWEYVERIKVSGIVGIVAVTAAGNLLLVEQFRPPLQNAVIELPAGLAGDVAGSENEALSSAAARELMEETGYQAAEFTFLTEGAASAGVTNEIITLYRASGLKKVQSGGGDGTENIQIHEVPLDGIHEWLNLRRREGKVVDLKIYAGLFFARM